MLGGLGEKAIFDRKHIENTQRNHITRNIQEKQQHIKILKKPLIQWTLKKFDIPCMTRNIEGNSNNKQYGIQQITIANATKSKQEQPIHIKSK